MIKVENIEGHGFEAAVCGMRNPLNSWEKSDSKFRLRWNERHGCYEGHNILDDRVEATINEAYGTDCIIGPNDMDLMKRLYKAGPEHRKFMRMIIVTMDITAPLYWWKEFDTYKIGTIANSCSTMHKIHSKEFTLEDFSHEHLMMFEDYAMDIPDDGDIAIGGDFRTALEVVIMALNDARELYLKTKDKRYWWQMIQLLPSSYNQRRTVMLNYEVLAGIYPKRKDHKLDEWREFCDWIKSLPYSEIITLEEN